MWYTHALSQATLKYRIFPWVRRRTWVKIRLAGGWQNNNIITQKLRRRVQYITYYYIGIVSRVCECDAAAVLCPRLIFYYSTDVFYTQNLLIVSSYNLFKPPRVISSRVYYIILSLYTYNHECACVRVCVYTFYLGTPPKGRRINPQARVLRNPPRIARTSDGRRRRHHHHHLDNPPPRTRKNFSPPNRNRQARDVPADCERVHSATKSSEYTNTSCRPSTILPTAISYHVILVHNIYVL